MFLFKKALLTILLFIASPNVHASACAGYLDINNTHQFCSDITFSTVSGWVNGYEDGTFKANKKISREEFTKIVVLASRKLPEQYKYGSNCFKNNNVWEIKKPEWASKYICFAKDTNIINGYSDGSFKPHNNVQYVEALKITLRAFGYNPPQIEYSNWYTPYIEEAQRIGVIPPLGLGSTEEENYTVEISRGYMTYLIHKTFQMHTQRTLNNPQEWDLVCDAKEFTFDIAAGNINCEMKWAIQILYETQLRAYAARASIIKKKITGIEGSHDIVQTILDTSGAIISLTPTGLNDIPGLAPNFTAVLTGGLINGNDIASITVSSALQTIFNDISTAATLIGKKITPTKTFTSYLSVAIDSTKIFNDVYGAIGLDGATEELNNLNIAISYLTDFYALGRNNERLAVKYAGLSGDTDMPIVIYNYALKKGYRNKFWDTRFNVDKIVASVEQTKVVNSTLVRMCYNDGKCYGQKVKSEYFSKTDNLMQKLY